MRTFRWSIGVVPVRTSVTVTPVTASWSGMATGVGRAISWAVPGIATQRQSGCPAQAAAWAGFRHAWSARQSAFVAQVQPAPGMRAWVQVPVPVVVCVPAVQMSRVQASWSSHSAAYTHSVVPSGGIVVSAHATAEEQGSSAHSTTVSHEWARIVAYRCHSSIAPPANEGRASRAVSVQVPCRRWPWNKDTGWSDGTPTSYVA